LPREAAALRSSILRRTFDVPDSSPIALFVFRRPVHARKALEALSRNREISDSPLFIYCDAAVRPEQQAAVDETRRVVRSTAPSHAQIIEREVNWGLARSIIAGATDACTRYGSVIVLEDDLVVAPGFLAFMNKALRQYADVPEVMQVSGHMFPVRVVADTDGVFLPFTTSWGWATWARAWESFDPEARGRSRLEHDAVLRRRFDLNGSYPYFRMLSKQTRGEIDSWAIRWYLSVFLQQGLALYPRQTLVRNDGFDGSGTHGRGGARGAPLAELRDPLRLPDPKLDMTAFRAVQAYLRRESRLSVRIYRRALTAVRVRLGRQRSGTTP
jgi:hypothetical protein